MGFFRTPLRSACEPAEKSSLQLVRLFQPLPHKSFTPVREVPSFGSSESNPSGTGVKGFHASVDETPTAQVVVSCERSAPFESSEKVSLQGLGARASLAPVIPALQGWSLILPLISKAIFELRISSLDLSFIVFFFEFLHEFNESFYSFDGHCVVDGSSHASHCAVTFKVFKACSFRFFNEFRVKFV